MLNMRFDNRVIVVTGGASGIGRSCAAALAELGARVVIVDRNGAAAETVARSLKGLWRQIDIADDAAVEAGFAEIATRSGGVDGLVNSAGILQRLEPPEQLPQRTWDLSLNVNLRGTYLCCIAAGKHMLDRGSGAIVNIASVAGMRSGPLYGYAPAKAAVISLTECLAAAWGYRGIRINAVSPGFTETPALSVGVEKGALNERWLREQSALGRLVRSDEIATAVAFLLSDLASAITGINLPVDAGHLVAGSWEAYGGVPRRAPRAGRMPKDGGRSRRKRR